MCSCLFCEHFINGTVSPAQHLAFFMVRCGMGPRREGRVSEPGALYLSKPLFSEPLLGDQSMGKWDPAPAEAGN